MSSNVVLIVYEQAGYRTQKRVRNFVLNQFEPGPLIHFKIRKFNGYGHYLMMRADIRDGFVRQRRNLIMMSLVVLFSEVADLKIEKISIFGNEATIGKPEFVIVTLWIFLIYWLIRYYQYFHEMGDKGFLGSFMSKRKQIVGKRAFWRITRDKFFRSLQEREGEKYKIYLKDALIFEDRISKVAGKVEFSIGLEPGRGTIHNDNFVYDGWPLFIPSLLSFLHVLFRTRYFSEYFLPFVVFALPCVFRFPSNQLWLMSLINL